MTVTRTSRFGTLATVIAVIADVMAGIIGLWLLMYLLQANRENDLVNFVHDASRWLAGWSYDMFTFDSQALRVVCGYGLAALVYLGLGNLLATRVRHY